MPSLKVKSAIGGVALAISTVLAGVYDREGGYVNHKADRGGATRYGITEKVARSWGYRGDMRNFPKHCATPTDVCADRIYRVSYIEKPGYLPMATLEPAVLEELVDSAVLHGAARSNQWFQRSLNTWCQAGLEVDGKVGKKTIAAYETCQQKLGKSGTCVVILDDLDYQQEAFFRTIVANDPSQKVFLKGWISHRIGNVDRRMCLA